MSIDAIRIESDGKMEVDPDLKPPVMNSCEDFLQALNNSGYAVVYDTEKNVVTANHADLVEEAKTAFGTVSTTLAKAVTQFPRLFTAMLTRLQVAMASLNPLRFPSLQVVSLQSLCFSAVSSVSSSVTQAFGELIFLS